MVFRVSRCHDVRRDSVVRVKDHVYYCRWTCDISWLLPLRRQKPGIPRTPGFFSAPGHRILICGNSARVERVSG